MTFLPFGQTVTVRRYTRDNKGNRVEVSVHTVDGVGVAPAGGSGWGVASDEVNTLGEQVKSGTTLYAPYGADIRARDTVTLADGSRWEVDGDPADWRSPLSGRPRGTVVSLIRVEG